MILALVLFSGILTMWMPQRWALSAFELAVFALAATRIAIRIRGSRSAGLHPVALMLAGAVLWGLIQVFAGWSVDPQRTLEVTLDWFVRLVVFVMALDLLSDAAERERFLNATLIFAAVLSVIGILTVLTAPVGTVWWKFPTPGDVPTLGPFVYRNQYAAFIEAVLPIALVRALRDRRNATAFTLIAALLFASVVVGGSRTGAILCLAEIVVVPVLAFARGMIRGQVLARALAGSLGAVVVATAVVGPGALWKRLQEPNPYTLRWKLTESSAAMVRDRPWTGFGLGTWSTAYPGYALYDDGTFVNQAHNDWVQWAAEGGLPFFALTLGIAAWCVRPALRTLWGVGILFVLVHGLVDYPMQQRPALAAFFFALLGSVFCGADPEPQR